MRFIQNVIFILFMLASTAVLAAEPDELTAQGFDSLSTGNYREAIELFLAALEENDTHIEATRGLIRVYLSVGDYKQAAERADSLSAKGKATPEILALGGNALAITGSRKKALEFYRKGLALDKSHIHCLVGAAEIESLLGNSDESKNLLEKARSNYSSSSSPSAREMVYASMVAVKLNRYAEANSLLEQAIEKDPYNIDALNMRANLFLAKYDYPYAKKLFERALDINPRHPETLTGLARVYEKIPQLGYERYSDAYSFARKALRTNRSHPGAYNYLAHKELFENDYERAESYIEKILDIDEHETEALALLSAIKFLKGDNEEYKKLREKAVELPGAEPAYLHGIALVLQNRFRYREALELAKAAIKADANYWQAYSTVGLNLLRLGCEDDAREYLEKSRDNDPFNVWTYNSLQLLMHIKDNFKEKETEHFLIKLHGSEFDTLFPYVEKQAEKSYKILSEKYGVEFEEPILLEMFRKHDFFSARTVGLPGVPASGACFGSLVTMDSPSARNFGTYNWARTLHHELTHVVTMTRSKNRLSRWFGEGCSTYEERQVSSNWRRNMERQFIDALARNAVIPLSELEREFNRPRGLEYVLLAYYESSLVVEYIIEKYGFDKVLGIIDAYGQSKSEDEIMNDVLGVDMDSLGKEFNAWAVKKFGKFKVDGRITENDVFRLQDKAEFNPEDAGIHARLARAYIAADKLLDAESTITKARKINPKEPEVFIAQAQLDLKQGYNITAKENYLKAIAHGLEKTYDVHLILARFYLAEDKKEEAIEYYLKAIEDFPLDVSPASPYRQLYGIYNQMDRKDAAFEQLEKIVELTDMEPNVRVALADRWIENGSYSDAVDILRELLCLNPLTSGIHERLGDALYGDELLDEAIEEYNAAVVVGGQGMARAYSGLAKCHFDLEKNKEAEEYARKAIELDPGNARAKEVLELLGKWSH